MLIFISKDYSTLLFERRILFLSIFGLINLVLYRYVYGLKIKIYDTFFVLIYGILIVFFFTDLNIYGFKHIDFLLSLWITFFSAHTILIIGRKRYRYSQDKSE
jgi:hypothetical protein